MLYRVSPVGAELCIEDLRQLFAGREWLGVAKNSLALRSLWEIKMVLITPDSPGLDAYNPPGSRKNGESCIGNICR